MSKEWTVALVGPKGAGKTAIFNTITHQDFPDEYEPTIEESGRAKLALDACAHQSTIVNLIDTPGTPEWRVIVESAIRSCDVVVFVVQLMGDHALFGELEPFFAELPPTTPFAILGAQSDVSASPRTPRKRAEWAEMFSPTRAAHYLGYGECSAKADPESVFHFVRRIFINLFERTPQTREYGQTLLRTPPKFVVMDVKPSSGSTKRKSVIHRVMGAVNLRASSDGADASTSTSARPKSTIVRPQSTRMSRSGSMVTPASVRPLSPSPLRNPAAVQSLCLSPRSMRATSMSSRSPSVSPRGALVRSVSDNSAWVHSPGGSRSNSPARMTAGSHRLALHE